MAIEKIRKSDEEWARELTPEEFAICRKKGTERPFTGELNDCKTPGTYVCACCGNPLFDSETKFDSGTGWPSFWAPIAEDAVATEEDRSLFMRRTEVSAPPATPISATSSKTARPPRACATA